MTTDSCAGMTTPRRGAGSLAVLPDPTFPPEAAAVITFFDRVRRTAADWYCTALWLGVLAAVGLNSHGVGGGGRADDAFSAPLPALLPLAGPVEHQPTRCTLVSEPR